MTPEVAALVTKLRAVLAAGATTLPWKADFPNIIATDDRATVVCTVTGGESNPQAQADAALIVAAVNTLPALLDAVYAPVVRTRGTRA